MTGVVRRRPIRKQPEDSLELIATAWSKTLIVRCAEFLEGIEPDTDFSWSFAVIDEEIEGEEISTLRETLVTLDSWDSFDLVRLKSGTEEFAKWIHVAPTFANLRGNDETWVRGVAARLRDFFKSNALLVERKATPPLPLWALLPPPLPDPVSTAPKEPVTTFRRRVYLPRGAAVTRDALSGLLDAMIDVLPEGKLSWSVRTPDPILSGTGRDQLLSTLDRLAREPAGISVTSVLESAAARVRAELGSKPQISVSGSDRNWVAGTEERLESAVLDLFPVPIRWAVGGLALVLLPVLLGLGAGSAIYLAGPERGRSSDVIGAGLGVVVGGLVIGWLFREVMARLEAQTRFRLVIPARRGPVEWARDLAVRWGPLLAVLASVAQVARAAAEILVSP